ncbi:DUF1133 family protein [Orbus mooreae]|uniref:DUF1133 family protein n=1 Tax=Orbus mooreae TaxID=3074107 RepID=UPI00370D611C
MSKIYRKSLMSFEYPTQDMSPTAIQHKRIKEVIKYNPDSGVFTSRYNSNYYVKGSFDNKGYLIIRVNGRRYLAHRLAWFYMTGKWSRKQIDHINGNSADNRFSNLREALPFQNSHNLRLSKVNTSGARCVHFAKSDQKWVASVQRYGQSFYLGRFTDKVKAIKAVNQFLKKIDGDFFSESINKRAFPHDRIKTLSQLKRKLELGKSEPLNKYQKIFMETMLCGWGAWAYTELKKNYGQSVSPLARLMMSADGYGSIRHGVIEIFEHLHAKGYEGEELITKATDIIASLRHKPYSECTDEEASFIDRMLIKTFGKNNPLINIATYYYVYGYSIGAISQYLLKITSYNFSAKQSRDRIDWCLSFIKEKLYASIQYELNQSIKK